MNNKRIIISLLSISFILLIILSIKAVYHKDTKSEGTLSDQGRALSWNEEADKEYTNGTNVQEGNVLQDDGRNNEVSEEEGNEVDAKEMASRYGDKEGVPNQDGDGRVTNEQVSNEQEKQTNEAVTMKDNEKNKVVANQSNQNDGKQTSKGKRTNTPKPTAKSKASVKKPVKDDKSNPTKTVPIVTPIPIPDVKNDKVTPKPTPTVKQPICSLVINCYNILGNMKDLKKGKEEYIPTNGIIYSNNNVVFQEGESVFDILKREMKENDVLLVHRKSPIFDAYYIEGIANIFEFDCGSKSGWIYKVNGKYLNNACNEYVVKEGDRITFEYTCNSGEDVK